MCNISGFITTLRQHPPMNTRQTYPEDFKIFIKRQRIPNYLSVGIRFRPTRPHSHNNKNTLQYSHERRLAVAYHLYNNGRDGMPVFESTSFEKCSLSREKKKCMQYNLYSIYIYILYILQTIVLLCLEKTKWIVYTGG